MDYSTPGSSVHGNSPGKSTGMSCHALLRGLFLTQGSNQCLLTTSPALAVGFFTPKATWEAPQYTFACHWIMSDAGQVTFLGSTLLRDALQCGVPSIMGLQHLWVFCFLPYRQGREEKCGVGIVQASANAHRSVTSDCLRPCGLYSPWDSPGQKTGVGSLSLLQGIFPTQGSNPGLPHSRQILYQLSHKGSPRILKWVDSPFSSGPSWPRNRTGASWIVGRFSTNWAIRAYQFLTTVAHN